MQPPAMKRASEPEAGMPDDGCQRKAPARGVCYWQNGFRLALHVLDLPGAPVLVLLVVAGGQL